MSNSPRPAGAYTIGARVEVVDTPPTGHRAAREVTARSCARQIAQLRAQVHLAERMGRDTSALRRRLDALTPETSPQIVSKPPSAPPMDRMGETGQ